MRKPARPSASKVDFAATWHTPMVGLAKGLCRQIGVELRLNTRSKRLTKPECLAKASHGKICDDGITKSWLWSKLAKTYVHLSRQRTLRSPGAMRGVIRDRRVRRVTSHEHRYDPWVDGYLALSCPHGIRYPVPMAALLSDLVCHDGRDAESQPIGPTATGFFLARLQRTFQPGNVGCVNRLS